MKAKNIEYKAAPPAIIIIREIHKQTSIPDVMSNSFHSE